MVYEIKVAVVIALGISFVNCQNVNPCSNEGHQYNKSALNGLTLYRNYGECQSYEGKNNLKVLNSEDNEYVILYTCKISTNTLETVWVLQKNNDSTLVFSVNEALSKGGINATFQQQRCTLQSIHPTYPEEPNTEPKTEPNLGYIPQRKALPTTEPTLHSTLQTTSSLPPGKHDIHLKSSSSILNVNAFSIISGLIIHRFIYEYATKLC